MSQQPLPAAQSTLVYPYLQGFDGLVPTSSGKAGFPYGSTLLVSGPPGAGKTTFAIALMRSLMAREEKDSGCKDPILYYISSEVSLRRLRKMFHPFGWLHESDGEAAPDRFFKTGANDSEPDSDNLYVVVPEPAVDRPVPTPEELVNEVFSRIAKCVSPTESAPETRNVLVIVDSVTALLKGCASESDERRQSHEILHRLRTLFGEPRLALTILLAEQDFSENPNSRGLSVEDYLADIVFRLDHKHLALGRRGRVLEIVKSQGVNLVPGEHSWEIVTHVNCAELFRHPEFQKEVERTAARDPQSTRWATVSIFPRPKLQHAERQQATRSANNSSGSPSGKSRGLISTGTPGLDAMLGRKMEFWLPRARPDDEPGLQAGTTTLVAGPRGAGKTTLCLQFLQATRPDDDKTPPSLLISLGATAGDSLQQADGKYHRLDFTQSHFDFNHLMAHLNWALGAFTPERIAFDGLSEWLNMFDRADAAKMLEALSIVIRHHPAYQAELPPPTVFITYELREEQEPLDPQALGVNADNIIVLRQVNVRDEIRKVVYILKSAGGAHDENVREVAYSENSGLRKLEVSSGLDVFNNLLRDLPESAEVILQFFQESRLERKYNYWLKNRLKRLNNLNFRILDYSRHEISRTLKELQSPTRFPPADLKILNVDEWWLGSKPDDKDNSLLNLANIWSRTQDREYLAQSWQDFWIFEVEKCGPPNGEKLYAVPGYMDFGIFCANARVIQLLEPKQPAASIPEDVHSTLLENLPRFWVNQRGDWFTYNASIEKPAETIVDLMVRWRNERKSQYAGFAFDMATRETCACAFFELAWAFGAPENFLDPPRTRGSRKPAEAAIRFLQFLVLEELMPPRASVDSTRNTLFSRHFYSTLQDVRNPRRTGPQNAADKAAFEGNQIALPFFPAGSPQVPPESWIEDIAIRWDRLIRRFSERVPALTSQPARRKQSISLSELVRQHRTLNEYLKNNRATQTDGQTAATNTIVGTHGDLLELSHWIALNLFLAAGKSGRGAKAATLASILKRFSASPFADLQGSRRERVAVPTGYCCTGSWMYGVHRASRSPSLARELLQEMTSLESAEERARSGAGIPSRRDFFELRGHEPVPGMEPLTWLEVLRYCGARSRRRERVAPRANAARLYQVIQDELLACLQVAYHSRADYHANRTQTVQRMSRFARQAFDRIQLEATN